MKKSNVLAIVHELLHLTGLVDEYPETSSGFIAVPETGELVFVEKDAEKIAYDCRKIYEKNSIMGNNRTAWSDAFSDWTIVYNTCKCSEKKLCQKELQRIKKNIQKHKKMVAFDQCPNGFVEGNKPQEISISNEEKEVFDKEKANGTPLKAPVLFKHLAQYSPMTVKLKPRSPGLDANLISERHFNAIVYPGCLSKNIDYYKAAADAYKTSRNKGGEGCSNLDRLIQ